ncbi:hypothetical protein NC99_45900 [Sunxiuqinia dokdonensis]|uniref:Uncharacterized protein n=1 Tax=Sunxiuqinia dokdonensis TaxID=1409788 RepID=A0A0L8V2Y0_9BACT|nr:hypothetical protein NC99_45900 [Sunxiuqinia dokdonensis]
MNRYFFSHYFKGGRAVKTGSGPFNITRKGDCVFIAANLLLSVSKEQTLANHRRHWFFATVCRQCCFK